MKRSAGANRCSLVKQFDIFGQAPTLRFRKSDVFKTWIGAVFTILALSLFTGFAVKRFQKLVNSDEPFLSMIT